MMELKRCYGPAEVRRTSPQHLSLLCADHQMHRSRERLTVDPQRRCAGKSSRTITKLKSKAERRRQTLIMARPWLDMLWKVTVDESSIIYSSAELSYLFFQQHEQQGIMAQNKQPVEAYSCDCQQTARLAQWWGRQWLDLWPRRRRIWDRVHSLTVADSVCVLIIITLSHVINLCSQCQ